MQKLLRFMSQEQTQGKYVATGREKETHFASKIHLRKLEKWGEDPRRPHSALCLGRCLRPPFRCPSPSGWKYIAAESTEYQSSLQRLIDVTLGKIILTISPKFPSLSSPHFE